MKSGNGHIDQLTLPTCLLALLPKYAHKQVDFRSTRWRHWTLLQTHGI